MDYPRPAHIGTYALARLDLDEAASGRESMEYQIRRYRIAEGKLDEFVDAWKAGVVPLRERFGFRFHGA